MTAVTLDHQQSERLGREGRQLALDIGGDWKDRATAEFKVWAQQRIELGLEECAIEEFRAQAIEQPHSSACWGGFVGHLCRKGLIAPKWIVPGIQARVHAAAPKTHGHDVRIWLLTAGCVAGEGRAA